MTHVGPSVSGARPTQAAVDINIRSASVLGTANGAGVSAPSKVVTLNQSDGCRMRWRPWGRRFGS